MIEQDASSTPTAYRFGDVEVDLRAHAIAKAGRPVAVEPKAFDVLVELLRRHGEAVPRDDLLDRVWGHRHVTPAVLNRVIAMLRRALGDDAEHPHLIRTVHGIGYCFMAPVEIVDPAPLAAKPPEPHEPHAPPAHWGDRRFVGVGAALLALAAIAIALVTWQQADRARPAEPAQGASLATAAATNAEPATAVPAASSLRIAMLPIRPPEGQGMERLANELSDNLAELLERVPGLAVTRMESARAAVEAGLDLPRVAEVLDVDTLVTGVGSGSRDDATIELALFDRATGAVRWRKAYREPVPQLNRMLEPALLDLQLTLLPDIAPSRDPALRATADAQRLYWEARGDLFDTEPERNRRALRLLDEAIALQPDYAIAYVMRATAWRNLGLSGAVGLDEAYTRGRADLARALEIDANLADAYVMEARLLTLQWRSIETLPALRRALALEPNNLYALETMADLDTYRGQPRVAMQKRAAILARNPLSSIGHLQAAWDYAIAGDPEETKRRFTYAETLSPQPMSGFRERRIRLALMYGDVADAARQVDALQGTVRPNLYFNEAKLQTLATLGRVDEARRFLRTLTVPVPAPPMCGDSRLFLFFRERDYDGALEWIDGEGRTLLQEPWATARRAHLLALNGREDEAHAAYAALFADRGNQELVSYSWYMLRIGVVELAHWAAVAKGRADEAEAAKAFSATVAAMVEGGVGTPALRYYRALDAALQGDAAAADRGLGEAIEAGFIDPVAFEVDLAWKRYGGAAWFDARRQQLERRLQREIAEVDAAR